MKSFSESYKAAGVDITAGYAAVELMKQHVARTIPKFLVVRQLRMYEGGANGCAD